RFALWHPVRSAGRLRMDRRTPVDRGDAAVPAPGRERLHRECATVPGVGDDSGATGAEEIDVALRNWELGIRNWELGIGNGRAAVRCGFYVVCGCLTPLASADAQPQTRRATNLATLLAYPGFYHGRPILIVGKVGIDQNQLKVADEAGTSI